MADTDTYSPNSVAGPVTQNMAFPTDLEKQPFWMSFSFYEYSMPNILSTQQNVYYTDRGTIRLPLPNNMVDDQHVQFSAEPFTGAVSLGTAAAAAVSSVSKATGVIANPFLTVMFKAPSFKQHALEWKLSPSNKEESKTLNDMINTFKYNMLPGAGAGGIALTYPNIVQITVSSYNPEYFTYVFKPAVVESLSVNYTPSGVPSFFGSTKAPTEVQIRLGIMEIEYWMAENYGAAGRGVLDRGVTAAANLAGWIKQALG